MARNIWPLVQNRKEENGRSPFSEWRFPLVRPCRVSKSKWAGRPAEPVCQSVSVFKLPGNYNSAVKKPNLSQPDPKFCHEVKETL